MKFSMIAALFFLALTASIAFGAENAQPACLENRQLVPDDPTRILNFIERRIGGHQVLITAPIVKLLPDDRNGLPHQKFIIQVHTRFVTVVSNLKLSRYVPVEVGALVTVCGEFLPVGPGRAMIHWSHYDPARRHPDGFTVYDGVAYGTRNARSRNFAHY